MPMGLSISANVSELILPCCPIDKPRIRSESGASYCSVFRCDFSIGPCFAKEDANLLIDISQHARTDVV